MRNCGYVVKDIDCHNGDCVYSCGAIKATWPITIHINDSARSLCLGDTIYFTRKSTK
jgi:hypothetical protein